MNEPTPESFPCALRVQLFYVYFRTATSTTSAITSISVSTSAAATSTAINAITFYSSG